MDATAAAHRLVDRQIVDPPWVRPAGSLGLLREDIQVLREFRCYGGSGEWFERDAAKVVRRAAAALEAGSLGERERVLLFERDGILHAVSVLTESSNASAELAFLGIDREMHGAWIDTEDGDRLSDSVLSETLDVAAALGYERITAQVARQHHKSLALLRRAGFAVVSRFDRDYDLCAVAIQQRRI